MIFHFSANMDPNAASKVLLEIATKGAIHTVLEEFCGSAYDKKTVNGIREAAELKIKELLVFQNIELNRVNPDLPPNDLIPNALTIKTFNVDVDDIQITAKFKKDGTMMYEMTKLPSGIKKARLLQKASIVSESIIFVIEIAGIPIEITKNTVRAIIEQVEHFLINEDVNEDIIDSILWIMKESKDTHIVIKNIIAIVNMAFKNKLIWKIVRLLFATMPWYEMVLNAARIAGFIGLLSTSSEIELLALKYSMLIQNAEFVQKLVNLERLNKMQ